LLSLYCAETGDRDRGLIAVSVACAASDAEARRLERRLVDGGEYPSIVVGSRSRCIEELAELAADHGTTELVLCSYSPRLRDQHALIDMAAGCAEERGLQVAVSRRARGRRAEPAAPIRESLPRKQRRSQDEEPCLGDGHLRLRVRSGVDHIFRTCNSQCATWSSIDRR